MEVVPKVHRIPGIRGANAYLLLGGKPTLVDTGMPGNAETILDYIRSLNLAYVDLTRIILTHYHVDHIGSAAALKQRAFPVVSAHPADARSISGERPQPLPRGALVRLLFRLAPALPRFDPIVVDVPIQDGDRLDMLAGATVVHVPGHTPGSIALYFPEERLLICGDAINHRGNRLGLPPKSFTEDMEQAVVSVRRLAKLDFDVLCPGRGDPLVTRAGDQVRVMVRALPSRLGLQRQGGGLKTQET